MGCALWRRPLTIARCSEILEFGHFWKCILLVLVPKPIVWQACCLHFGILGALGRSRSTWEHKKGDLGVQALIFIDFELISGAHFESFSGPLD